MDPGSTDDIPLTDFAASTDQVAAPTDQEAWRASAETFRGDTSTDHQQQAAEAWSKIRSLGLNPPLRSRVMNSLKRFDSELANSLATTDEEVRKAYDRRTRLDIPTVVISLATLAFWGAFAGAWSAAGDGDSGPIWGLSAASVTSVAFFLADVAAKTLKMGPRGALETLLDVAATYDRDPSHWSEARKQYWDRETNVQNLVNVAAFLDSMASVHQPDDA